MELFFQYLKQRRPWIGVGILFAGIFGLVFYLYRLPLEAVLYPTVLCGVLGLGLLIRDFQRVRQKYRQLSGVRTMADAMVGLPPAEGLEEAAYQQIVRLLCQEQNDLRTATGKRYQDMVDYYTIWAHQIKTPIASMDLTLQGEDSPLSRKLSGELLRIGQYVQMVLMFLRLDGDTTDYVFREQALDPIVRQAVFLSEFFHIPGNRPLGMIFFVMLFQPVTDLCCRKRRIFPEPGDDPVPVGIQIPDADDFPGIMLVLIHIHIPIPFYGLAVNTQSIGNGTLGKACLPHLLNLAVHVIPLHFVTAFPLEYSHCTRERARY